MDDEKMMAADIAAAEKLMGIEYTPEEREFMVDNLDGQIKAALARRDEIFPNSLPPATSFDPRLPGQATSAEQKPFIRSDSDPGPLPPAAEDIAFAPVTALSEWLRTGQITSRRLTEIYLERLKTFAPKLECVVTLTEDLALQAINGYDPADRCSLDVPFNFDATMSVKGLRVGYIPAAFQDEEATDIDRASL